MSKPITVTVHEIAVDGLPDMDALCGRVAFIFDGEIVSGWPLEDTAELRDRWGYDGPLWEGNRDVAHHRPFANVTHWIEFPEPVEQLAKKGAPDTPTPADRSKPLEWRKDNSWGEDDPKYMSTTEFHEILRGYTVYAWDKHWRVTGLRTGGDACAVADTADAAKAIAQRDYDDRRRLKDWENYMLTHEPPRRQS